MPETSARTKPRLVWPDVAKGISILGVCFLHTVMTVPGNASELAEEINRWLGPIRLPLFFVVSGLFASKIRTFSLTELWTKRLRFLVIPYLVWSPAEKIINAYTGSRPLHRDTIIEDIIVGNGSMWFLHALSIFVVFLWLTKFVPYNLGLPLAFVPYLWLLSTETTYDWSRLVIYLPAYACGMFLKPMVLALAQRVSSWQTWAWSFVLFLVVQRLFENFLWASEQLYTMGLNIPEPKVNDLVGGIRALGSLPFAILISAAIANMPKLAKFFTFFGRNTLVIYVGHPIVLTLGFRALIDDTELYDIIAHGSATITWVAIAYGMSLCAFAGWFFEALKVLPIVGKTLDPSISWLGQLHTPAHNSAAAAPGNQKDPSRAARLGK